MKGIRKLRNITQRALSAWNLYDRRREAWVVLRPLLLRDEDKTRAFQVGRGGNKIKVDVKRLMLIFQIIKQSNFSLSQTPTLPSSIVSLKTPTN